MVKLTAQPPIGTRPGPVDTPSQAVVNGKQPAAPRVGDGKINSTTSAQKDKEEEIETNENIPANVINGAVDEDVNNKNKKKLKKMKQRNNGNPEERMEEINSIFAPKDGLDLNGGMDAADREIEQFKQFCFNSVPVQNRAKVNFDVKNISFKKKS